MHGPKSHKRQCRAQTLRILGIHIKRNNMGVVVNHHISISSSHGLIAKSLSLLLPSSSLPFAYSVKLLALLPHPCSVLQKFSLAYFSSFSQKAARN